VCDIHQVIPLKADNKNNKRGIAMNKKNALSILFLASFLAMVLVGMIYLQPEKVQPQTAEYELRGFPALTSERQ
jgi:hypothetical protein